MSWAWRQRHPVRRLPQFINAETGVEVPSAQAKHRPKTIATRCPYEKQTTILRRCFNRLPFALHQTLLILQRPTPMCRCGHAVMRDGRSAAIAFDPFNVIANAQDATHAKVSSGFALQLGFKPSAKRCPRSYWRPSTFRQTKLLFLQGAGAASAHLPAFIHHRRDVFADPALAACVTHCCSFIFLSDPKARRKHCSNRQTQRQRRTSGIQQFPSFRPPATA